MKKIIVFFAMFLFILLFVRDTFAQLIQEKRFELSTSASFLNVKHNRHRTDSEFNLRLRFGVFLHKGLEIEPELFLNIQEDLEYTGVFFLANISQNFKASKRIIPFILGGVGFGNGEIIYDTTFDQGMKITAFNFGAGIKYLLSSSAAFRIEYRFTKYMGKETVVNIWGDPYTYELDRTDNNVIFGISIFL
jgi:hypothetical protein